MLVITVCVCVLVLSALIISIHCHLSPNSTIWNWQEGGMIKVWVEGQRGPSALQDTVQRVTYKLESNKKQIKILFFFFYLIGLAFFTGSSSALGGTVQRQVHSLHHSVVSQFLYNHCFSEWQTQKQLWEVIHFPSDLNGNYLYQFRSSAVKSLQWFFHLFTVRPH